MSDTRPIGFFDSGVGGLSVWRVVVERLPHENTIYFADSAHCPYGSRPTNEIKNISAGITRYLLSQKCKLIVVACNTASAAALTFLRDTFDVPFVGMEPAVKPAAQKTQTGHVGVLATAGTLQGALFQNTAQHYASGTQLHVQVGKGLVEQVENCHLNTPETKALLHQYLDPMLSAHVDQIALGCTHYPLLLPLINQIVNGRANVIDPAQAVARQVERVLTQYHLAAPSAQLLPDRFYTTGQPQTLQNLATALSHRWVDVAAITLPDIQSVHHP